MGAVHDQHLGLAGSHQLRDDQLGKHRRGDRAAKKTLAAAIGTVHCGHARQTTREFSQMDRTHLHQRTHQATDSVDAGAREGYRPLHEGFFQRMNKHGAAPVFRF